MGSETEIFRKAAQNSHESVLVGEKTGYPNLYYEPGRHVRNGKPLINFWCRNEEMISRGEFPKSV